MIIKHKGKKYNIKCIGLLSKTILVQGTGRKFKLEFQWRRVALLLSGKWVYVSKLFILNRQSSYNVFIICYTANCVIFVAIRIWHFLTAKKSSFINIESVRMWPTCVHLRLFPLRNDQHIFLSFLYMIDILYEHKVMCERMSLEKYQYTQSASMHEYAASCRPNQYLFCALQEVK